MLNNLVQIPTLLDEYFPTHGLWQGDLSFGEVAGVWLMLITSQGDHGLSPVQPWVAERLDTLTACVGKPIRPLDFSDDRLANLLDRLAETDRTCSAAGRRSWSRRTRRWLRWWRGVSS